VDISILIPKKIFKDLKNSLFAKGERHERVAFIFASINKLNGGINFQLKDWYPVKEEEYRFKSSYYVELIDEMRVKIIKMAHDLDASLIEVHSHRCKKYAKFSSSDFHGFKEFVPHVWWRLNERPYAAIVFSETDFDGFAWIRNPQDYEQLNSIIIGEEHINANCLSIDEVGRGDIYGSI